MTRHFSVYVVGHFGEDTLAGSYATRLEATQSAIALHDLGWSCVVVPMADAQHDASGSFERWPVYADDEVLSAVPTDMPREPKSYGRCRVCGCELDLLESRVCETCKWAQSRDRDYGEEW